MADITSLVAKVRIELGDLGKSFVTQFVADGTTNRFQLHYSPLDAASIGVYADGIDITADSYVEESTGILSVVLTNAEYPSLVNVGETVPKTGVAFTVSGTYYRYFTAAELASLVETAVGQHTARHTDSIGRKITVENLPVVDEYPVAVYATTLALYTLATDASFDIDISAPDGVAIPRSERYRQLMEMIQTRQTQYRDLCVQLGIGMYAIEVFSLRRISKITNKLVPVYKPMEVDDRSYPQRVYLPQAAYGDVRPSWPTENGEFTAYQGVAWTQTYNFTGDYTGQSFIARLVVQRGSIQVVQNMNLLVTDDGDGNYVATMSLTADQTMRLSNRTYWQILSVDDITEERIEIVGGNFFTQRASEVIL